MEIRYQIGKYKLMNEKNPKSTNSAWTFQLKHAFMKLNQFLAQLKELKNIFETAVCFQNLEKVEIGGMRGKFLTDQLKMVRRKIEKFYSACEIIYLCKFNYLKLLLDWDSYCFLGC